MNSIHDVTKDWTASMDEVLLRDYAISPITQIEKEIGRNKTALYKRAKILKIDNGNEKHFSLEEMNSFTQAVEETNCDIKQLCRMFPNKKTSSIYSTIESLKGLSSVPCSNPVIRGWESWEDLILKEVAKGKNYRSKEEIQELHRKLPNRTPRAIAQRLSRTKVDMRTIAHKDSINIVIDPEIMKVDKDCFTTINKKESIVNCISIIIKEFDVAFSKALSASFETDGLTVSLNVSYEKTKEETKKKSPLWGLEEREELDIKEKPARAF